MMPALSIKDWITLAVVGALVVVSGWLYVGKARVERNFADYKHEVAQNTLEAEQLARRIEQNMQNQIARIIQNEEIKRKVLSDRVARVDAVNGGLRDEIARLNARPAPADPTAAAYAGEARTARELLGACSVEYRGVAKAADELRDQVIGLHDYIRSIQKPRE